jgi:hypothetical protein
MQKEEHEKKSNWLVILSILFVLGSGICLAVFSKYYFEETKSLHNRIGIIDKKIARLNDTTLNLKQGLYNLQQSNFKQRLQNLEQTVNKLDIQTFLSEKGLVDFTSSSVQDIGDGYFVVNLDMDRHLTGIKLSGRIINTLSVRRRNCTFEISMGRQEKEFTINIISPGNSTIFSVYIPDIKPESAHFGKIKSITSTVEYRTR